MRSDGGLYDDWGKRSCFCYSMGVLCESECYELRVIKLGLYHKVGNRISVESLCFHLLLFGLLAFKINKHCFEKLYL